MTIFDTVCFVIMVFCMVFLCITYIYKLHRRITILEAKVHTIEIGLDTVIDVEIRKDGGWKTKARRRSIL